MTPEVIIARLDKAIAGYGQSVVLERTAVDATGGISVAQSVTCPAAVRSYVPQDLEAGSVQPIRVILSPTGLGAFGLPSRDDRVLVDGNPSNIEEVGFLKYGGVLVRINMFCRG
jgi:hypothetical protein